VRFEQVQAPPPKPTIRQRSGDGMNKWERAFLAKLRADFPDASIHREPTLPLANGTGYKVDFVVARHWAGRDEHGEQFVSSIVLAYEVKGFARSTGIVKLKVAAALYPWISFKLVTQNGGAWNVQDVRP